jgi:bisphosphoglycerate-independent phosphoglycerate mutase (AlkP superfamily)
MSRRAAKSSFFGRDVCEGAAFTNLAAKAAGHIVPQHSAIRVHSHHRHMHEDIVSKRKPRVFVRIPAQILGNYILDSREGVMYY